MTITETTPATDLFRLHSMQNRPTDQTEREQLSRELGALFPSIGVYRYATGRQQILAVYRTSDTFCPVYVQLTRFESVETLRYASEAERVRGW